MTAVTRDGAFLLDDQQCSSMLDWVAELSENGLVLRAFLASVALAALRPTEALALRVRDAELPDEGVGVLLIRPQGREGRVKGTDSAEAVRRVPACSELVTILKEEISRRDLSQDDLMFVLDHGRPLSDSVYRQVWRKAREAVLKAHEADSPHGVNVSSLRDACIAAWLRNGDQTAAHIVTVSERAGMSAPQLAERFAHCLHKPTRAEVPWGRLEAAFELPVVPSGPMATGHLPVARRRAAARP